MDSAQHPYGTRIRHNISMKPSVRRRQSPEPNPRHSSPPKQLHTISPNQANISQDFPPPHLFLHKDDANSKVFLAIARSLLSVDNRATTVKDLADLAVLNGLGCANSSAATQAITTYLRAHNERCEADNDQPLLLSHNLSGADADDDLIPALYSLQGGSPRKISPTRKTNFRKNTAVWYLSRATGAPCPFARAGISLCDYGIGQDGEEKECRNKHLKQEDIQTSGRKRKRPLRSCVIKDSSDSELEKRPPKKLTLRIKPLNCASSSTAFGTRHSDGVAQNSSPDDSSDDSMSVGFSDEERDGKQEEQWRLPPYPRRSISIPCYTPSYDGSYPQYPGPSTYADPFRRSPSIPHSIGSPPPDSEDEADDFHVTMTRTNPFPEDTSSDIDQDSDLDSEGGETQFESPGPRSPSAPLLPPSTHVAVKEEPRDVQGMLEAWEDFDSSLAESKATEVYVPSVALSSDFRVKSETVDLWDWDSGRDSSTSEWDISSSEPTARIKEEDISFDSLFPSTSFTPSSPLSTPSTSLSPQPANLPLHSPSPLEIVPLREFEDDWQDIQTHYGTLRPRSKTVPAFALQVPPTASRTSFPVANRRNNISDINVESTTPLHPSMSMSSAHSIASLIQSMNFLASNIVPSSISLPSQPPCVSPCDTRTKGSPTSDVVVVHTCQPCTPPISATQIEDISVYQMMLGPFLLLRRIDTDFVNLTPIVAHSGAPRPILSTIINATVITKGSPIVSGTWVPLTAAQAYVKDHHLPGREIDIFLSDELYERFPTALQDFHKSNAPGRLLNQFGRHFGSTLQASRLQVSTELRHHHQNDLLASAMSPNCDPFALSAGSRAEKQHEDQKDPPLSATEQEIFELCVIPDWDKDSNHSPTSLGAADTEAMQVDHEDEQENDASDTSSLTSLESISSPSASFTSIKEMEEEVDASRSMPSPPPTTPTNNIAQVVASAQMVEAKPPKEGSRLDRPLRRSKRVADAVAAHPGSSNARTRTRRRGSRNSLS